MLVEGSKEMEQRMVIHLVYGVHNLYEHCDWALQDLLGIHELV